MASPAVIDVSFDPNQAKFTGGARPNGNSATRAPLLNDQVTYYQQDTIL
jgi:hypothetical protein